MRYDNSHKWTKEDEAILLANYNTMTGAAIAELIGCSQTTITYRRKKLGLKRKRIVPKYTVKAKACFIDYINKNEVRKLYNNVCHNSEENGIDSSMRKTVYQNNKDNITVITLNDGVLRINKSDLRLFLDEMKEIAEVYGG